MWKSKSKREMEEWPARKRRRERSKDNKMSCM
jgi:hypothetical protein